MRFCIALLLMAAPATAQPMLSWPLGPDTQITQADHDCADGSRVGVTYLTAGDDALALIQGLEGPSVLVNVVSASGARYVAGLTEWWVKGNEVTLTQGDSATTCTVTE